MVPITFEKEVRKSFSKVKDDVLTLKRSINDNRRGIDELGARLKDVTAKDEFYSFIKRLGERLESIENQVESIGGYEDEIKEVDAKLRAINRKVARQEELGSEIKEIRKIRGKVASLEGSIVNSEKFNKELHKIALEIAALKRVSSTQKDSKNLEKQILDLKAELSELQRNVVGKHDLSKQDDIIVGFRKELAEKVESANKEIDEKVVAVNTQLEDIKKHLTHSKEKTEEFEAQGKDVQHLREQISALQKTLDQSVSEVDFNEYATRQDVDQKIAGLPIARDVESMSERLMELEGGYQELRKESATRESVQSIGSDVQSIVRAIDKLNKELERAFSTTTRQIEVKNTQLQKEQEKEINRLRKEFDISYSKDNAKKPQGLVSRLGKGVSDFFTEEDQPKKEAQVWNVSELIKDAEKKDTKPDDKKENRGLGIFLGILLLVIIAGGIGVFFLADVTDGAEPLGHSHDDEPDEHAHEEDVTMEESDDVMETDPEPTDDIDIITPVVNETEDIEETNESMTEPEDTIDVTEDIDTTEDLPEEDPIVDATEPDTEPTDDVEVEGDDLIPLDDFVEQDALTKCIEQFECTERSDGQLWHGCHVDANGICRCFVTDDESICDENAEDVVVVEEPKNDSKFSLTIIAGVVLAVLAILYLFSLMTEKDTKPKEKTSKEEKSKSEKHDDVDLGEFFEKKN